MMTTTGRHAATRPPSRILRSQGGRSSHATDVLPSAAGGLARLGWVPTFGRGDLPADATPSRRRRPTRVQ